MAKFQFRLATLLRLREATRDEKRSQLAEAFRAEDALRRRLSELRHDLDELKRRHRATISTGRLDVDRLIDAQRYELLLLAEQQSIKTHEQSLNQEIDRRRTALVEADREVRVLEKLQETQADRARDEEAAQDAKRLDEMSQRPLSAARED